MRPFLIHPTSTDKPHFSPDEREGAKTSSSDHPEEVIKEEKERDKVSKKQISEDDDGFKTPTSPNHIIPAITQGPPAPKKARPPPSKLKRKASPSGACRSLQFDAEVESIFRPICV
ncbi:hypothetical protein ACS0TY_020346 [Phlomoides rotata]